MVYKYELNKYNVTECASKKNDWTKKAIITDMEYMAYKEGKALKDEVYKMKLDALRNTFIFNNIWNDYRIDDDKVREYMREYTDDERAELNKQIQVQELEKELDDTEDALRRNKYTLEQLRFEQANGFTIASVLASIARNPKKYDYAVFTSKNGQELFMIEQLEFAKGEFHTIDCKQITKLADVASEYFHLPYKVDYSAVYDLPEDLKAYKQEFTKLDEVKELEEEIKEDTKRIEEIKSLLNEG